MTNMLPRLQAEMAVVCPLLIGVSVTAETVTRIDAPGATAQQLSDAQTVADNFDWSQAAQDTWFNLQSRTAAEAFVDTNKTHDYKVHRAVASVAIDEVNALRSWITSFKAEVAAATTLADLKTRVAGLPNLPQRTLTQAKTAIKAAIASGTVD